MVALGDPASNAVTRLVKKEAKLRDGGGYLRTEARIYYANREMLDWRVLTIQPLRTR